jgi:isocitrate/isopropylmalate dehydrogenase
MTALGINNPNSYYNRSMRRSYASFPSLVTTTVPEIVTVRELAERAYIKQQTGLNMMRGGGKPATKGEMIATEAERQMALLAEYADELAEVLQ